mgnify:CR=1 FL=1
MLIIHHCLILLKGTTSVMFCETANAPAKLLKEYKEGVPALKAAYAEEGFYVGADQLEALATIKSKNEVIAISWHCCNLLRRTLFLLFSLVVTPFTEFLRLWVNVQNNRLLILRLN